MTQGRFKEIIEQFVVYLYPSLKINGEVNNVSQTYAELMDDGSLNIKGDIHGTKGFNITREQPFH